jgi:transketolase
MELAYSVKKLIKNTNIRIVNFVSWELFDKQESSYQSTVLGNNNNIKVSIEAGITDGWQKYTGLNGLNFGINSFGTSAPGPDAAEYFKLSAEYIADSIVNKIKILL